MITRSKKRSDIDELSQNKVVKRARISQTTIKKRKDKPIHKSLTQKVKCSEKVLSSDDESSDDSSDEESNYEEEFLLTVEEEMENLKKDDPKLYKKLVEVKEEIQRTEPNIKKILNANMRIEDKAKLCQYFEIYKSQHPNTEEWMDARNTVNDKFKEYKDYYKQYSKFTHKQHQEMEKVEKECKSFDSNAALKYKILGLKTNEDNKKYIYNRYEELQAMESHDDEYSKLKNWLNTVVDLPYDSIKNVPTSNMKKLMTKIAKRMDDELYGMDKVKEQLLVFIHAKLTNPNMKRCNLGLIGNSGVGKTAISRLLAKVLDFPFEQISFGGVDKPDFLKGHEYTYVGAQPGAITKALKKMGCKNGILYFDEYEKISENKDICSALLHICDPEQQEEFTDLFVGMKQDLRYLWMIYSMNAMPLDNALSDRIFPIEVKGYTHKDKVQIVKKHLLRKALENAAMKEGDIIISDEVAGYFINRVCNANDKGVRTIEKKIIDVVNKIKFLIAYQDEKGNIPLFKISFSIGKQLSYPVDLTREILDRILESKDLSQAFLSMYI